MQLLELEHELRQCGGESERATVDGSEVHDVAKNLELDNDSVAGSEGVSGFMALMVSQSNVRTNLSKDYQTNDSIDMHNENGFDYSTLTVKAEETPRCLLFPTSIMGSPMKRFPTEQTPLFFQTSSLPMGDMGGANSVISEHRGAPQMAFSGRYLPKLKLREFAGHPPEWLE